MRIFSLRLSRFTAETQFGASQDLFRLRDNHGNVIFLSRLQISWLPGIILAF